MADEIPSLPPTIAQLPFFAAGRFPKPDLLGRCEGETTSQVSGREMLERVREIGLGLQGIGVEPGDRVLLLAESRPEWLLIDFAILASGAVTVPAYPTLAAPQVGYVIRDSGASVAVVSTTEQLAKVLAELPGLPDLRTIIVTSVDRSAIPASGKASVAIITLAEITARGHQAIREGWGVAREFHDRAKRVQPADLATIVYTSGTTGDPKGVMLSHGNLVANLDGVLAVYEVGPDDVGLSFLPLSHAFERIIAYAYMARGVSMVFAETLDTLPRDIRRVRPTVITGVPRLYEKLYERVVASAHEAGAVTRRVFDWASGVAMTRADVLAGGGRLSLWLALQSRLADRLVFGEIRENLGGRFRFVVSGGAPLGEALARWFYGTGIPLVEGYGLTETSPVVSVAPLHAMRFGTVGPPLPNVELRIADDGEVLARGPSVMIGYYNRPAETAAVMRDGWFCTGDIGQVDECGYLRITDRKKELLVTSGGKKIAPQPIEADLRRNAFISDAVLVGDSRRFPAALIVPNFSRLAAHLGVSRPGDSPAMAALLARPDVRAIYTAAIDAVNRTRSQYERIKEFRLLPRELTIGAGELTPTMKVKRRVIDERYKELIEEMYRS
ncbi:MAG TPA: long-chain fatty acid--CoA ligase [Vicinamibacterales bacterium]|nr:long-chain fatty acid--CoA ligase [Vicinamibacterales bacterium]